MKSSPPARLRPVVALRSVDAEGGPESQRGAASVLLATKLYVPVTRAEAVCRPRLHARLDEGVRGPLTLLSAPAGSGKTTVVAKWLSQQTTAVAWFSIDERDSDVARFVRYFVAAIDRVVPGFAAPWQGEPAQRVAAAPLDLATDLVNAVHQLEEPVVIVLDDYHLIDSEEVHDLVSFVVEANSPNIRIVMTTRVDPPLPLSRLRARGQLAEIGAEGLRFTRSESAAFLTQVMGLTLTDAQVERLEARTEGWAVGLQMAALSLKGKADAETFIAGFAGSHRYVLDYLMDEVLHNLTAEDREFLMQTSILRELTGPLVDAVTQSSGGSETLLALERSNLFTLPLDGERTAYRYHHLFGTLLRHQLEASRTADAVAQLHARASGALQAEGQNAEAVEHAVLAGDLERAVTLLIPLVMRSTIRGECRSSERLMRLFPAGAASKHPQLCLLAAWLDYYVSKYSDVRSKLRRLRGELGPSQDAAVEAELNLLDSMAALECGDLQGASAAFEHVEALPSDRPYLQLFVAMHRACLSMMEDRLLDARGELDVARGRVAQTDDRFAAVWVEWQVAHVDLLLGRLSASARAHDELLETVMGAYDCSPPSSSVVGFATGTYLYLHLHDLARARELVATATSMGEGLSREHGYASCLLLPKAVLQAQAGRGEDWSATLDQAIRHLDALEQATLVPRIEAQRVRLALHARSGVSGQEHARRWLQQPGIRAQTHEVYLPNPMPGLQLDLPRFVLGRALAATGALEEAQRVATDCLQRAEQAERRVCQVEALLLLAEIDVRRDVDASPRIAEAVMRAASADLVGPFVEFESTVLGVAEIAQRQGHRRFAEALRAAHAEVAASSVPEPQVKPVAPATVAEHEPLSDREREVLSLVAQGLTNAQASKQLFIAPSTVKKHLEHIYGKLGVNRRTQAVARARSLGLLGA